MSGFPQKYSKIIFKRNMGKLYQKGQEPSLWMCFLGLFPPSMVCGPAVSTSSRSPFNGQNLRPCHGQWPKERDSFPESYQAAPSLSLGHEMAELKPLLFYSVSARSCLCLCVLYCLFLIMEQLLLIHYFRVLTNSILM